MHKTESVLKNETHKSLWDDFIPTRRPNLVLNDKKKQLVI